MLRHSLPRFAIACDDIDDARRQVNFLQETRQVQGVVSLMDVAMFLLQEGDPSAEESPVA